MGWATVLNIGIRYNLGCLRVSRASVGTSKYYRDVWEACALWEGGWVPSEKLQGVFSGPQLCSLTLLHLVLTLLEKELRLLAEMETPQRRCPNEGLSSWLFLEMQNNVYL